MIYYIIAYIVMGILTVLLALWVKFFEPNNEDFFIIGYSALGIFLFWPMILLIMVILAITYVLGMLIKKIEGRL